MSPATRTDIILGKDINLAALLIPGYNTTVSSNRHMVQGDEIIPLKPLSDSRLNRVLTMPEFLIAFSVFKNVFTSAYPLRTAELDAYQNDIIDMAAMFPGQSFYDFIDFIECFTTTFLRAHSWLNWVDQSLYDCHKTFSARSAAMLACHIIKIDWSTRDTTLFCSIFAGHKANACSLCNSLSHTTVFSPQTLTFKDPGKVKQDNVQG